VLNCASLSPHGVLFKFSQDLEAVCISTVEEGHMTKDLALAIHGKGLKAAHWMETQASKIET